MHNQFILKPNPYITRDEAESAYTKFMMGQFILGSAVGSLILRKINFLPGITSKKSFRNFIIVQFSIGAILGTLYTISL